MRIVYILKFEFQQIPVFAFFHWQPTDFNTSFFLPNVLIRNLQQHFALSATILGVSTEEVDVFSNNKVQQSMQGGGKATSLPIGKVSLTKPASENKGNNGSRNDNKNDINASKKIITNYCDGT